MMNDHVQGARNAAECSALFWMICSYRVAVQQFVHAIAGLVDEMKHERDLDFMAASHLVHRMDCICKNFEDQTALTTQPAGKLRSRIEDSVSSLRGAVRRHVPRIDDGEEAIADWKHRLVLAAKEAEPYVRELRRSAKQLQTLIARKAATHRKVKEDLAALVSVF